MGLLWASYRGEGARVNTACRWGGLLLQVLQKGIGVWRFFCRVGGLLWAFCRGDGPPEGGRGEEKVSGISATCIGGGGSCSRELPGGGGVLQTPPSHTNPKFFLLNPKPVHTCEELAAHVLSDDGERVRRVDAEVIH